MKFFKSREEYEAWTEQFEDCSGYEKIPVAIDDGWKVALDMFTECKSWKTALRRFEKTFAKIDCGISDWVEGMRESCEVGIFKEYVPEDNSDGFVYGGFSYGVEAIDDDQWYIYLNVSGNYAGR